MIVTSSVISLNRFTLALELDSADSLWKQPIRIGMEIGDDVC